ncbi:MAG: hypothetical protein HRU41_29205 [Saprospiraceae bacterium]|nr:hypothetical protein [Saprospiraceae bacterium]
MRILSILSLFALLACSPDQQTDEAKSDSLYTTDSDSTIHYYLLGWHQILNQGFYGPAEVSYRKALSFDSTFLLGQSVLARLTEDLEERQAFYEHIQTQRSQLIGEEGDLLEVFLSLLNYTLSREKNPDQAAAMRPTLLARAQTLLCGVRLQYPNIDYIESECVEFIHATQGAAAALDSLSSFREDRVIGNAFLAGYEAVLLAELKRFEEALALAEALARTNAGKAIPRPDVIMAHVYYGWGKLEEARTHIDKAVKLDPRNLEATRLQTQILAALSETIQ